MLPLPGHRSDPGGLIVVLDREVSGAAAAARAVAGVRQDAEDSGAVAAVVLGPIDVTRPSREHPSGGRRLTTVSATANAQRDSSRLHSL